MNDSLNCIAIDDDRLALDLISEFCSRSQFLNLTGTFTNPLDAVPVINTGKINLIFLDIVMPQISGLDFLKSLYNPPMVIFTTAFKEYAAEAFENNAADYLVKPFTFERFSRAVSKAFRYFKLDTHDIVPEETVNRNRLGFIMVKVEYSTIRVDLNDILYIEGLKDYVKIFTEGKLILTKTTMKNIIEKLPSESFFRVHKSYIVSVGKIEMIENSRIVIGNQRIPIGESFRVPFLKMIGGTLV